MHLSTSKHAPSERLHRHIGPYNPHPVALAHACELTCQYRFKAMWWPGADRFAKRIRTATNRHGSPFEHRSEASMPDGRGAGCTESTDPSKARARIGQSRFAVINLPGADLDARSAPAGCSTGMARVTNSPGANLGMRSMPEGRCTGMCSVNQPPTRGFSVNRFHNSPLPNVSQSDV